VSRGKVLKEQRPCGGRIDVGYAGQWAVVLCRTERHHLWSYLNGIEPRKTKHVHFRHIVRNICMIPSVRSSHSPPFPLTIPPMPDAPAPAISVLSSIRSAFVHATTIGTPPALCVSVPGPRGRAVPSIADAVAGIGSAFGSV